jgi:hypothetical protein
MDRDERILNSRLHGNRTAQAVNHANGIRSAHFTATGSNMERMDNGSLNDRQTMHRARPETHANIRTAQSLRFGSMANTWTP